MLLPQVGTTGSWARVEGEKKKAQQSVAPSSENRVVPRITAPFCSSLRVSRARLAFRALTRAPCTLWLKYTPKTEWESGAQHVAYLSGPNHAQK